MLGGFCKHIKSKESCDLDWQRLEHTAAHHGAFLYRVKSHLMTAEISITSQLTQ